MGSDETEAKGASSNAGKLSLEATDDRVIAPALRKTRDDARAYAKASQPPNTARAYRSDWGHYLDWCQSVELSSEPADPEVVGLYLTAMANGTIDGASLSVSTIDRRLSALSWTFRQLGQILDRKDPHIAAVLAGIKRLHGRRPAAKEAAVTDDLLAMLDTLDMRRLGHIRDKAILLLGFAGGLRRSEIVGLDVGPGQSSDKDESCKGWVEFYDKGILLKLKSKNGFREVEIGHGTTEATCPAVALKNWMNLGRVAYGPIFRRVYEGRKEVGANRLCDDQVALIVKRTVDRAGVGGRLPEGERVLSYAGHSLRSGLASSAEIDEGKVQKHLGHADVKMTRRYQRRRERFRVNLTKASGL